MTRRERKPSATGAECRRVLDRRHDLSSALTGAGSPGPPGPVEAQWLNNQRRWAQGWRRLVFPTVFLLYLLQTVGGIDRYSRGLAAVAGYAVLVAFCVGYVAALQFTWSGGPTPRFWLIYGGLLVLCAAEAAFAHQDALVMLIYLVVISVAALNERALLVVAAFTAVAVFAPATVGSWHRGVDGSALVTIPLLALAMFGFFGVIRSNQALGEARGEVARLAAENERSRIARDLHDLLGHSLTTITVKAGLARRLFRTDPERAAAEIAEVEDLSRLALADVRAAVSNYREVTLAGELATATELLRAAGIEAVLPGATDSVEPAHQELFGWVLREGLTNVVRHAHATICTVILAANSVEITDNGVGASAPYGSGLLGLRERVEGAGGTLATGPVAPTGWQLRVQVPAVATTGVTT